MSETFPLPSRRIDAHNHLWGDPDGAKMLDVMDKAQVDMTVIMGTMPNSLTIEPNEKVIAVGQKYPDRFVVGAFLDPRDGKKAIEAMKAYHSQGAKIVKLFPNYGYYPDDDEFIPFFEQVAELGMAVLSHCGSVAAPPGVRCASYYSYPGRFEKVIRSHPETIFIMAHMGGMPGWLETIMLTTRTPNTFTDCSPGQGLWVLEKCGPMIGSVPSNRLLFGADGMDVAGLMTRYAEAMAKLDYGPDFDKIFYGNARGIFEKIGAMPKKP